MPPLPRKATILVVEDDDELRTFYRIAMSMAGYAVVAVEDGLGALRHIETDPPDGILLDLTLPRLGGRDLQKEIAARAETRDIPIVVITATPDQAPGDVTCVLQKPITLEDLLDTVRRCFPPPAGFSMFH